MMQRKPVLCAAVILVVAGAALAADYPDGVLAAKAQVKGKSMVATIDFLSSKYCRGRETGDVGSEVAAKYLTTFLSGAGVTPAGDFGSYMQTVPLQNLSMGSPMFLDIEETATGAKILKKAKLEDDFLPIELSAEKEVTAELAFAGYGITAPEYKYDDYQGINVAGKIVLLLRHEPRENDEGGLFEGRKMSNYGTLLTKIRNAAKHGAVGVLVVNDPLNHQDDRDALSVSVGGTYWPELREVKMKKDEDYKFMRFSPRMKIGGDDFGVTIPVMGISLRFAAYLVGENQSLLTIQQDIDKNLKPRAFAITGKKAAMAVRFNREEVNASNIVAKIEGSDPELKNEYVIIGAHFDHLGKNNRGQIFPGADDNASGTAAVVEIARAFQGMTIKPKRTLIFILFCGEEKGLLGSRYYAEHPLFPLEKTVAAFDLDMIGRNAADQLCVLGKYQYPKLFALVDEINRKTVNMELNLSVEQYLMASDHFPFLRHNVPALMFNTGDHDQYHRPEDTVGRILPDKVEKVAQLTFLSMWQIAELPAGSKFN